ncbi:hypothetical protein [Hymenobacter chitinivorans]|uniref:DUF4466 domain-containing protein n=1 Tax=Hymenobacter chitinivorans DSM 11115 TaxID=1121954 RepID=A0A2M9ARZ3_9BACT|nr:hypothetical protein [Hymenobacter chitinivorans]PJJ48471.1 hypothetical protein CLV45_4179 [Hymenobacter chitinivorans DSM 11115]
MRLRFPLSAAVAAGLLASACAPDSDTGPNPYVNLVGSSRYVSASRLATTAGDTLTSKLYAEATGSTKLKRLLITVGYSPRKNPITYPATGYNPNNFAEPDLVYLDSTLSERDALAYQFTFNTRTTSGSEQWNFAVFDTQQHSSSRGFRLTLRNSDSALVYHRYTVHLQQARNTTSRSCLALPSGLALPGFTVRTNPAAQQLVDLICVPTATGKPSLATLADKAFKRDSTKWLNPRITQLRRVPADQNTFSSAVTAQNFTDLYSQGETITNTGPLLKNQLFAFITADGKYGLLTVVEIRSLPVPTLDLQVRIAK